jgi:hypothetical protein
VTGLFAGVSAGNVITGVVALLAARRFIAGQEARAVGAGEAAATSR